MTHIYLFIIHSNDFEIINLQKARKQLSDILGYRISLRLIPIECSPL
jgi:hypothetical protein